MVAFYDNTQNTVLDASLSIGRTIFICVVLTVAALLFTNDANTLVLAPIETMLEKVKRIGRNPLEAAQIEEDEAFAKDLIGGDGGEDKDEEAPEGKKSKKKKKADQTNYETQILERTIIKIGALLALGFGEAGSEIIAKNMEKSGEVDPLIPGKKMMAIFGFCDIRNFTDATEVLQEEVMVFVNEIADIVHSTVDYLGGSANKNIGDAFLLVWKFPEEDISNEKGTVTLSNRLIPRQIADMSVLSFLKILSTVKMSKILSRYNNHQGLNERMPGYAVKMGFGLHWGWAIEGAIGSDYKIDASYLSPNVNMASRMEAATKQFGVPLLITGDMYKICTEETQSHLRHIDRVTVKGSTQPMDLYTCDLHFTHLAENLRKCEYDASNLKKMTKWEKKKLKIIRRINRNELKAKILASETRVSKLFHDDEEIRILREPFNKEFTEKFASGLQSYFDGNWTEAKRIMEITKNMVPNYEDGPSNTILSVIQENGGSAPKDWRAYRELTEK